MAASSPTNDGDAFITYWCTRDRVDGVLLDEVEIWLVRPERRRFEDGDVMWLAPLDVVDRRATRRGTWTVAQAQRELGAGVPATDRECVCRSY